MSFLSSIFGSKPTVPDLPALDLEKEQQKAVQANIDISPKATELAGITTDQISKMLSSFLGTDSSAFLKSVTSRIQDQIAGNIPKDVQQSIQNNAAAKAIGGGFGGSGMHSDLVARDFGTTSLNLINQGISSAQNWLSASEQLLSPALSVFTNMFLTPGQQAAFDVNERDAAFQRQWMQNQVDAMPNPESVGLLATFTAGAPYWLGNYHSGQGTPQSGIGGGSSGGGGWNSPTWEAYNNATPQSFPSSDVGSQFDSATPQSFPSDGGSSSSSGAGWLSLLKGLI